MLKLEEGRKYRVINSSEEAEEEYGTIVTYQRCHYNNGNLSLVWEDGTWARTTSIKNYEEYTPGDWWIELEPLKKIVRRVM